MKTGLILLVLIFLTLNSFIVGCVAVQEQVIPSNVGEIPEGYSALLLAVPMDYPRGKSYFLETKISSFEKTVFLEENAINLVYLPVGYSGIELIRLPQEANNARTEFYFGEGEVVRLTLYKRNLSQDQVGNNEVEFVLLPSNISAFNEIVRQNKLEVKKLEIQ